jgi:hypothetical protein
LLLFLPALIWNARHGWVSFAFQGGRVGGHFYPLGPLAALGGAALYVLPWLWLPLVLCGFDALRRGPADPKRWLLFCLALPSILFFTVISLWSRILFHWVAPGYMLLIPLLGDAIAHRWPSTRRISPAVTATVVVVVLGVTVVASDVRFNWLVGAFPDVFSAHDPAMAAVDWTPLRAELAQMGLLDRPGLVVAATRWLDAGKIDYALGGAVPVLCMGSDPREYGIVAPVSNYVGSDVLIIAPRTSAAQIRARFGDLFDAIEVLPAVTVPHAGRPALTLPLYLGHRLRRVSSHTADNP